jgi:hypothetical protein
VPVLRVEIFVPPGSSILALRSPKIRLTALQMVSIVYKERGVSSRVRAESSYKNNKVRKRDKVARTQYSNPRWPCLPEGNTVEDKPSRKRPQQ